MNVLMRQNVFDRGKKKILAGICELFTRPKNLAFSGRAIGKQHSQKQHGAWLPCCVMHVTYSELLLRSLKLVIFQICTRDNIPQKCHLAGTTTESGFAWGEYRAFLFPQE